MSKVIVGPEQIDLIMESAQALLTSNGVYVSAWPAGWARVRSWLALKLGAGHKRSARQAALCYLQFLTADLLHSPTGE